ncbi:MAG: CBS domain-containing protein [Firmicutes bacterium]|jgi:DNA-binding protein Fis|nr:CBS domain-containing protein [Bacillota bacterium]
MIKFENFLNNISTPLFRSNTLMDALKIFKEERTDVIPVIDDHFNLVGILELSSIFEFLLNHTDTSTVVYILMKKDFLSLNDSNFYSLVDNIDTDYYPATANGKFIGLMDIKLLKEYIKHMTSIAKKGNTDRKENLNFEKSIKELIDKIELPIIIENGEEELISNQYFNEEFSILDFDPFLHNKKSLDQITFSHNNTYKKIISIPFKYMNKNLKIYIIKDSKGKDDASMDVDSIPDLKNLAKEIERNIIVDTLIRFKGNKIETAKHLGISKSTLYYKLNKMGIPAIRKQRGSL